MELINNKSYYATVSEGLYSGKQIYGRYDEKLQKLFVLDGFDKGFSIGLEYVKII